MSDFLNQISLIIIAAIYCETNLLNWRIIMIRSILGVMLAFAFTIIFTLHASADNKLTVFVSIAPQKYFVQQIA
jgi:hypothetical protein